MRGPEHVSIAVATTGGALWLMSGQMDLSAYALSAMSIAGIGSLVPDIDHPQAWISNRIPASLLAGGIVTLGSYKYLDWSKSRGGSSGIVAGLIPPLVAMMKPFMPLAWFAIAIAISLLATSIILTLLVEHRGPTHSLLVGFGLTMGITLGLVISGAPWMLGLWFGWGFLTHLLADMTTSMGCPSILWPLGSEFVDVRRTSPRAPAPMPSTVHEVPFASTTPKASGGDDTL